MKKTFGLIGSTLSHSFSKNIFEEKFFREELRDYRYELFPLASIEEFPDLLKDNPTLAGLSITVPYKEKIIPYLDDIDSNAKAIGAVNVIKFTLDKKLIGYNTDRDAFLESIEKWYPYSPDSRALIFGTGGSSKAVQAALQKRGIPYTLISRDRGGNAISYNQLEQQPNLFAEANLLINSTPLGMFPNDNTNVSINFELISASHFVYDLIYNPARTIFLQRAEIRGATIKNGLEMLHFQAEKAWKIWNS